MRRDVDGRSSYSCEIESFFMVGLPFTVLFMACDSEGWKVLQTFIRNVCRISETEQFVYTFLKTLPVLLPFLCPYIFIYEHSRITFKNPCI